MFIICKTKHIGPSVFNLSKLFKKCIQKKQIASGVDSLMVDYGWILGYLYHNQGQDIFQKDLESRFHLSRSSITGIVQNMESQGYIKRTQVPSDARLKKLELTDAGIAFHTHTAQNIEEMEKQARLNISDEDLNTFHKVLDQMQTNLTEVLNQNKKETTC